MTALAPFLGAPGRLRVAAPVRARRVWLDTFDWRLFEADQVLEQVVGGGDGRLCLRSVHGDVDLEVTWAGTPRFAEDLPPGLLRRRLAPLLDVRSLAPRVVLSGTLETARVLDRRDKTVVRLELWRPARRGSGMLRLRPVRGFQERAERVARRLGKCPEVRVLEEDPLHALAAALPLPPGAYPSWKLAALEPGERADEAVKALLRHYADIMALNLDGMREDLDSEFLHDFRVGLRRSRALLRRVPGLFAPRRIDVFRDDLAWLGQITGPPRDADVHQLVFPHYAEALGGDHAAALAPLMRRVDREQQTAHVALVQALDSPRFRRRWPAWRRFLEQPVPRASRQPWAMRPVAEAAAAAIVKADRRIRRQGRAISADSPPEAYHDVRKSCKNLRYLIDAFGVMWPGKKAAKATKALKALQDVLGEHQDLDVHRAAIVDMHRQMVGGGEMPGETHAAMELLIREMHARAVAARGHFAKRFEHFSGLDLARVFRAPKP